MLSPEGRTKLLRPKRRNIKTFNAINKNKYGTRLKIKPIHIISIIIIILIGVPIFYGYNKYLLPHIKEKAVQEYEKNTSIKVAVLAQDLTLGSELMNKVRYELRNKDELPDDYVSEQFNLSPYLSKIDLKEDTLLTKSMLIDPNLDETVIDSSRVLEINYVVNNQNLKEGDFIDIRLKKYSEEDPLNCHDYIVVTKKKVLQNDGSSIYLKLNEDEIQKLGIAAVDAVAKDDLEGELYSTVYVDPYNQEKAVVNYLSTSSLQEKIQNNPNIINNAVIELQKEIERKKEEREEQ